MGSTSRAVCTISSECMEDAEEALMSEEAGPLPTLANSRKRKHKTDRQTNTLNLQIDVGDNSD